MPHITNAFLNTFAPQGAPEQEHEEENPFAEVDPQNYERIQKNIQGLLDGGASAGEINRYLNLAEGIETGVVEQKRAKEPTTVGNVLLSATRGSIKGVFGLASLPFLLTDLVGSTIRSIADPNTEGFDFDPTLSSRINQGGENIAGFLDPSNPTLSRIPRKGNALGSTELEPARDVERGFVSASAEKVGELALPGAAITAGLSSMGYKFIAKNPEQLKFWSRALRDLALNPRKAQALELGINTVAGTSGEAAVRGFIDPNDPEAKVQEGYVRLGAELGSLFGIGVASTMVNKVNSLAKAIKNKVAFTEESQKRLAEIRFGELANEIMESDAHNITKRILEAEQLEAATGIKFTSADVFQNPDFQSAFDAVIKTSRGGPTKYYDTLMTQRERLQKFTESVQPILMKGDNLKRDLGTFLNKELTKIDNMLTRAEKSALSEAELVSATRDPQEIGNSAIEMVKLLEREALDKADDLYGALDPTIKFNSNKIRLGILESSLDPRFRKKNIKPLIQGGFEATTDIPGTQFGNISKGIVEAGEVFSKGDKVPLGSIVQYRRMVQDEFRLAGLSGDTDTMRRLGRILTGIDGQLASASKRARTGRESDLLKQANEFYSGIKTRFDKSYEAVGLQRDLSGMFKSAPEDFVRRFLTAETRQGSVQTAKAFKELFADSKGNVDPQALEFLKDSVRHQLVKFKKPDGTINTNMASRWLQNHKRNLQAHGIWDDFKDIGRSTMALDEASLAAKFDRKAWETSQLSKLIKSENPREVIRRKLKAGTLSELASEVRQKGTSPGARRAWNREVWDALLEGGESGTLDSAASVVRDPDNLLKIIKKNKQDLVGALGKDHVRSLEQIAKSTKLIEGKVPTFGGRPLPDAVAVARAEKEAKKAMFSIRRMLQGFVSRQFTFVELTMQGLDIIGGKAAQQVVEHAMYDWRYARQLADLAGTRGGREAMRILWLQAASVGSASLDSYNNPDPRTEF